MHEPLEPGRLLRDDRGCLARLDRSVLHRLRVAADRGQRRLQLVADRKQELALRLTSLASCAARSLNAFASVASSAAPSTGTGSGCSPRARLPLASATRRTGRAMRRARRNATTAASAPPTSAARSRLYTYGVQRALVASFGRNRMNGFLEPVTRRAAKKKSWPLRVTEPSTDAPWRSADCCARERTRGSTRYDSCCRSDTGSAARSAASRRVPSPGCRQSDLPGARGRAERRGRPHDV